MHNLFFLIGSSGSGKTTAGEALEAMRLPNIRICFPDRENVPSLEEMIKEYGSTDEWQKMHTFEWIGKAKNMYLADIDVLIDIQSRPNFIEEGCKKYGVGSYKIVLFDCSDEERKRRLTSERNQPELANDKMMDWARYLREACVQGNCEIIDNTNLTKAQSLEKLLGLLKITNP